MSKKRCAKCKENKPLEDFYKSSTQKDSRQGYCKSCSKIISKEATRDRYRQNIKPINDKAKELTPYVKKLAKFLLDNEIDNEVFIDWVDSFIEENTK